MSFGARSSSAPEAIDTRTDINITKPSMMVDPIFQNTDGSGSGNLMRMVQNRPFVASKQLQRNQAKLSKVLIKELFS